MKFHCVLDLLSCWSTLVGDMGRFVFMMPDLY